MCLLFSPLVAAALVQVGGVVNEAYCYLSSYMYVAIVLCSGGFVLGYESYE